LIQNALRAHGSSGESDTPAVSPSSSAYQPAISRRRPRCQSIISSWPSPIAAAMFVIR
jgi:hypothetical protein